MVIDSEGAGIDKVFKFRNLLGTEFATRTGVKNTYSMIQIGVRLRSVPPWNAPQNAPPPCKHSIDTARRRQPKQQRHGTQVSAGTSKSGGGAPPQRTVVR